MQTAPLRFCALTPIALSAMLLAGCGRDTRVNSDPGAGAPSQASSGNAAPRVDPNAAQPTASGTSATTGTDSTGRPGSASGGTTAAGSGSGTSGTQTSGSSGKAETGR